MPGTMELVKVLLQLIIREELVFSGLVKGLVWWFMLWVKIFIWPGTYVRSLRHRQTCPPIMDPLLLLPASDLANAIRTRQVSCWQVVLAYVGRAREVNPLVNAIVMERFREALDEAREIDELLAAGRLTDQQLQQLPLLGVPLTVKESVAVKGMSNNAAWSIVPQHIAAQDADVVVRLRKAGAIPILVSNTPELCMNWETYNPRVGRTNNPYDYRRTSAGSSGGEAALLGCGASVVGVASDICGSLRLPAMFTGVYGHKPSPGFVNNVGHRPSSQDERWDSLFTLGPMTRYAADLPLMLRTMMAPERAAELRLDEPVDLRRVRVFFMEDDGPDRTFTDAVSPEIKVAMRRAVSHLQNKHGATVKQVCIEGLGDMINYATFLITRMNGIPNVFQKTEHNTEEWNSVTLTFLKRMMCMSSASLLCLLYGPLKGLVDNMPEEDFKKVLRKKDQFMSQFKELLGEDGVFLYPTFPDAAHLHGQIFYKFLNTAYMSVFNVLEMPATACPLGLNSSGLPIGIQISAWQRQDRLTFAVARALEQEFGGWVPPCTTPDH